jgi:ribosomal protein S18 acetylase RimI-like enzyme
LEAQKLVAAYALIVDAKDEAAVTFYKHYGFTPCKDNALNLYLPLGGR